MAQPFKIAGKVTDAATREPLAFATLHVKNSGIVTQSDSLGNFSLQTPDEDIFIEVSSLGYKLKTVKLRTGRDIEITIPLTALNLNLQEVVIKPVKRKKRTVDTAALYVFSQVMLNKQANNPQSVPLYYVHEHNKLIISLINASERFLHNPLLRPFGFFFEKRDTTASGEEYIPLLIEEEYNETYHRASPLLNRKVVYYRRMAGFKKNYVANLVANQFEAIDIYKNTYIIAGKSFTSPFSPAARFTYTYHILDTIRNKGSITYKINFVAKNKEDVALKGYAIIDSATWGIQYIHFRPNEKANVNFLTDYSVDQKFEKTDSGWVLKNEKLNARGNLLQKQKKIAVYITKLTVRDTVYLNHPVPDSVSKVKDDIIVANAFTRSRKYMDTVRIAPLDDAERHIYHSFDTAKNVPAFKRLQWMGNLFTSGNFKAGPIDIGRSYYLVSRNAVEGYRFRLGAFTNDDFSKKVYLYAHAAYGTTDKRWKYEGDARFLLPTVSNRWNVLWLESKNDMTVLGSNTDVLGDENPVLTYDNILTLLSPGSKNNTVMHIAGQSAKYEHDWFKGLSSDLGVSFNRFYSTPGAFIFEQNQGDNLLRQLNGFNTTELSAELRYCYKEQYVESYSYRYFVPTNRPSFTFKYTWGIKNPLYGDYNYHKFQLNVRQIIFMPVIGYGKFNLTGGYTLGDVPYPNAYFSSSNIGVFKDELSFQLTRLFEFASDKYVTLWYEQHFEGFLLNRIPLIKRLKLREFVSAKAMWGGLSNSNQNLLVLPQGVGTASSKPYLELGFGIENIVKIIQLNFVWRATYRDTPGAPNFGIKIGIRPGF